jgi:hypothetical protein
LLPLYTSYRLCTESAPTTLSSRTPQDPLRPTVIGPARPGAISTICARGVRLPRQSRTAGHVRRCVTTFCGVPGSPRHGSPPARNPQSGLASSFAGAWRPSASRQPLQPRTPRLASRKRNTSDPDCHEIVWRVLPRWDRRRNSPRLRTAVLRRVVDRPVSPHTPFDSGAEKRDVESRPRDVTITTCHQLRRGTRRQVACLSEVSWPTSMNTFPRASVNNALRLRRRGYAAPSSYSSTPLTLRTLAASSCIVATAWLRRTYLGLMTEVSSISSVSSHVSRKDSSLPSIAA